MNTKYPLFTTILFCLLVCVGAVSAEGKEPEHVGDQLIAIAAKGELPRVVSGDKYTMTEISSTEVGRSEIVTYQVEKSGEIDMMQAIEQMQSAHSTACVDYDYMYGAPGGYIGSGTVGNVATGSSYSSSLYYDQWAFDQINLDPTTQTGGAQTTIAILDAFQPNSGAIWSNQAVTFHTPIPLSDHQPANAQNVELHGSLVTSLARSVAPDSEIMQVAVLNEWGVGTLSAIVQALDYVLEKHQTEGLPNLVVNMSFGTDQPDDCGILEAMLADAKGNHDVVFVASAGNDSPAAGVAPALYPASSPYVVAVAASNSSHQMAAYSHDGLLMAPGGEHAESNVEQPCDYADEVVVGLAPVSVGGGLHVICSVGTSFAAPFVSGAAATMLGVNGASADVVIQTIDSNAEQNGDVLDLQSSAGVVQ